MILYGQIKIAKKEENENPASWVDRGLLGGIGYGAKDMVSGHPIRGAAEILGSPLGAAKGAINAEQTAVEDFSRALSQLASGKPIRAAQNGAKGVVNTTLGPLAGSLIGHGLLSKRQMDRWKKPELEQL